MTTSDVPLFERLRTLRHGLGQVMHGKTQAVERLLIGVLAGGHVLMEDVPGVGKTTLAKALARATRLDFARIQFTPDLLPADILGSQILHPNDGSFEFRPGPVFAHVLLADEINRASPRTQSALLEAMNESQITVDGTSRQLPQPFFVIATQNPVEFQGTYPLPEAQLDRFLLRLELGYPAPKEELELLYTDQRGSPLDSLGAILDGPGLIELQSQVRKVLVKPEIGQYCLEVIGATRRHRSIQLGVSPRGSLAFFRAAQARAFLHERGFVTPLDFQELAEATLAHRLVLTTEARYGGKSAASILDDIITDLPVPL